MAGSIVNSVKTGKGNFEAVVDYTDPDYEYSTNPTMLYGHWFTWDDYDSGLDVAVLSEKDAIRMFGWWGLRLKWMMEVPLRMSGL